MTGEPIFEGGAVKQSPGKVVTYFATEDIPESFGLLKVEGNPQFAPTGGSGTIGWASLQCFCGIKDGYQLEWDPADGCLSRPS